MDGIDIKKRISGVLGNASSRSGVNANRTNNSLSIHKDKLTSLLEAQMKKMRGRK